MKDVLGLVMTGGGARGAYQAGVLKRIGEIKRVRQTRRNPFPVIGSASAGAINGVALAAGSDDFPVTSRTIAQLWSTLRPSDVFRSDVFAQATNSFAWILDLSFGAILGGGNAHSLIDAKPLRRYLGTHLHCERIDGNIKQGHLYAVAVSATNYTSGKSYLFIQGKKGHPMWSRSRRVTLATAITVDHVCASAAIPLVFQPIKLESDERLFASKISVPEDNRRTLIDLLNARLADAIDMQTQAKFAHWNVKGEDFYQLHLLFDSIAEHVEDAVDLIAERVTALGGRANGTARQVAVNSGIKEYDLNVMHGMDHVRALLDRLSAVANAAREAIKQCASLGDDATADVFTEIVRAADKDIYFLQSHLQGGTTTYGR